MLVFFLPRQSEWIAWAYAAALGACAAFILFRWAAVRWKYRDRRALAAEPRCGRCGYIIRPGGSVVCSECGGDVREVGIVTPGTGPPIRSGPAYLLAALAAAPLALAAAGPVAEIQPFGWRYFAVWSFYVNDGRPTQAVPHSFNVMISGNGRYFARRPELVAVYHRPPDSPRLGYGAGFIVRTSDMRFQEWDVTSSVMRDVPFSRKEVSRFLRTAVPDAAPEERDRAAEEITPAVVAAAAGQFPLRPMSVGTPLPKVHLEYSVREHVYWPAAVVVYVALLAVIMVPFRRVTRRRRRAQGEAWRRAAAELGLVEPAPTGTVIAS